MELGDVPTTHQGIKMWFDLNTTVGDGLLSNTDETASNLELPSFDTHFICI